MTEDGWRKVHLENAAKTLVLDLKTRVPPSGHRPDDVKRRSWSFLTKDLTIPELASELSDVIILKLEEAIQHRKNRRSTAA